MVDPSVLKSGLSYGERFFQLGLYREALDEFERVAQLDPNCADAFIKCGNAFFEMGNVEDAQGNVEEARRNFEDARRNYQKAVLLDPESAEAHYRFGLSLFKLNDRKGAVKEFERAITLDAAFVSAYYSLGEALDTLGQHKEASLKYEKVVSFKGELAEALYGKAYHKWGRTLLLEKNYKDCLTKCRLAYESGLRDWKLFHIWAVALIEVGQTEDAIAKYKEAIEHNEEGDLYGIHNNLGRIYNRLYRDEEALEEFELAAHDGDVYAAIAYNNWGNVLLRLRRYNEASEKYHKSIEQDPDYAKAYYNKAYILWQQGKHKEARRAWKEALDAFARKKATSKDTEHFRLSGNISDEIFQDEALAEKDYLHALTLYSENVDAMINLIKLYLGQMDEARDAVERNETQVKAHEHYGNARRILKRRLEEAQGKSSDEADIHLAEGKLHQAARKYAEAQRAYLKALEALKAPALKGPVRVMELQAVYVGLGNSYIQQEDYKKGAEYLELALEENADDLLVKSHLAEAYRKLGRKDKAERMYEDIFAVSVSHVESYIGRGELCKMLGDEGDVDMYDYAVTFFTDALSLSKSKDASKILRDKELAALLYSRGYASVKLYENTKPPKDESLLKAALSDFQISYRKNKSNLKAKRAFEKLSLRLSYTRSQQALKSVGPPTIFGLSIILFFVTQYLFFTGKAVIWNESIKGLRSMGETHYALLTFGSLIFMIAGLSLPQLLKIKIAGVELEKSTIEQVQSSSNLGISK